MENRERNIPMGVVSKKAIEECNTPDKDALNMLKPAFTPVTLNGGFNNLDTLCEGKRKHAPDVESTYEGKYTNSSPEGSVSTDIISLRIPIETLLCPQPKEDCVGH